MILFWITVSTNEDVIILKKTKSLQPDRLAFYSYAHVPWIKGNGQRGLNEDIPKTKRKSCTR
jgi:oxygen-independent coproporphyrinogen-3 oxidase